MYPCVPKVNLQFLTKWQMSCSLFPLASERTAHLSSNCKLSHQHSFYGGHGGPQARHSDAQTDRQKASQNHSRTEEDAELKLWNQLFPWENPDKMNPRPHLFLEITVGRSDTRHGWKQLIMTTIHSCLFHLRRMFVSQPTASHVRIMMRNGWVNVFD